MFLPANLPFFHHFYLRFPGEIPQRSRAAPRAAVRLGPARPRRVQSPRGPQRTADHCSGPSRWPGDRMDFFLIGGHIYIASLRYPAKNEILCW